MTYETWKTAIEALEKGADEWNEVLQDTSGLNETDIDEAMKCAKIYQDGIRRLNEVCDYTTRRSIEREAEIPGFEGTREQLAAL